MDILNFIEQHQWGIIWLYLLFQYLFLLIFGVKLVDNHNKLTKLSKLVLLILFPFYTIWAVVFTFVKKQR